VLLVLVCVVGAPGFAGLGVVGVPLLGPLGVAVLDVRVSAGGDQACGVWGGVGVVGGCWGVRVVLCVFGVCPLADKRLSACGCVRGWCL
jgi:hypothetical protein